MELLHNLEAASEDLLDCKTRVNKTFTPLAQLATVIKK
jgi:hypothetical protein